MTGGGVHDMLGVRVCAAHVGGVSGPKFSKQGSPFRQIFHEMDGFRPKLIIKMRMMASFGN